MPDHVQYAAVLVACLLVTLPLELVIGARVYRRPRALLLALLPVVAVFVVWDLAGIGLHHWSYSARYTLGIDLGPMPVEELAFFVVIPICGLLTLEAVGIVLARVRGVARRGRR